MLRELKTDREGERGSIHMFRRYLAATMAIVLIAGNVGADELFTAGNVIPLNEEVAASVVEMVEGTFEEVEEDIFTSNEEGTSIDAVGESENFESADEAEDLFTYVEDDGISLVGTISQDIDDISSGDEGLFTSIMSDETVLFPSDDEITAVGASIVDSGTCGDHLTWTLDSEGTLTISGEGEMEDFYGNQPWNNLVENIKTVIIENGVTSIGANAFENCINLSSITFPDSVTNIGNWAFSNCSSLTSIEIPLSVTSIGDLAFEDCTNLEAINVDSGNTNYSSQDGVLFNIDKTHLICCPGGIAGVYTIPLSVTNIGWGAFFHSSLTNITIQPGVTSIEDYAFYGCSSLTEITIPSSVTSIGDYAFELCISLTSITIPSGITSIGDYAFYECRSLTEITIPESVTSVGNWAFYYCTSLTSITIPDSVTSIGDDVFEGCSDLTIYGYSGSYAEEYANENSIPFVAVDAARLEIVDAGTCGDHLTWTLDSEGTLTISGEGEMEDDNHPWNNSIEKIKTVIIENGVTSIGDDAFYKCSSLTSIELPSSVTRIGDSALLGCSSLTSIELPSSVTSIGNYAFEDCRSLISITIPDSVMSIGNGAFYYCSSLTKITIPSSVTSIGAEAFEGCTDLTIYGYTNSIAQTYAKANNIPFISLDLQTITLAKPAAPSVKVNASSVTVTWKKVSKAKKYKIYRTFNGETAALGTTTKLKFTDKTVQNGKAYSYQIQAVKYSTSNAIYKASKKSAATKVVFITAPKGLKVISSKAKKAVVTWKRNSGAKGYQVRYSLKSSMSGAKSFNVTKNTTLKKTLSGLKSKKAYYFQIRSYKTYGGKNYYSKWSSKVKVKVK